MIAALAGKPPKNAPRNDAALSSRSTPALGLTPAPKANRALESASAVEKLWLAAIVSAMVSVLSGCGTTKSFTATEQLLVSDAVDSTVSKIDFRPLSGHRVFLDNSFLPTQKGVPNPNPSLVHSEYVTSSLRQQMLAAGVMLCEKKEEAEIIVEARMGALGFDGHSVTYGVPASSSLSTAASTLSGSPMIPILPELSFAKKEAKSGAAKLALFAYDRQSLEPIWQSGIARSSSTARDTWVLGVGPLQNGTIYEGTRFAGSRVLGKKATSLVTHEDDEPEALVDYKRSQVFTPLSKTESEVATAQNEAGSQEGSASAVTQASATAPSNSQSAAPKSSGADNSTTAAPKATSGTATAAAPAPAATATAAPTAAAPAVVPPTGAPATPAASATAPNSSTTPAPTAKHIDDLPKN